ncbi:hypothetical protein FE257_005757 [Aspergillus nanangensis]|uniref:Cupin type-2 domain-containing protein n=1 Tax=Aspergillus nanangensis TaxID=2582783 RepID=A0AAD4CQ57_ASPNN|nr:hypothetical protein FE257_005757 [Aspergillus nanangensis]
MSKLGPKAVVLSPGYIAGLPIESFEDISRGEIYWRTLFTRPNTPTSDFSAGIAVCPARTGQLCQHNHAQAEIYYILKGRGIVTLGGVSYKVEPGSAVFIPGSMEHSVATCGDEPLEWLYIFPSDSFSDVVYRFSKGGKPKL